jgi:hypothetical protein
MLAGLLAQWLLGLEDETASVSENMGSPSGPAQERKDAIDRGYGE